MKRDKLDAVFSELVRLRTNYECERCGKVGRCECAHFYGRRDRKLRHYPANAFCLCHSCHRYFTENPAEFVSWAEERLGSGLVEILRERHNDCRLKYTKSDMEELYQHLKFELNRMKALRAEGVTGRIDFEAWD